MASDAFAISPIPARAVEPDDVDYEAIRKVFMETARGRWFLGEYAKRNRTTDASMVLDAVSRLENALARQRSQLLDARREAAAPPLVDRLGELFASIHRAVAEAQASLTSACDELALSTRIEPVLRASRIIREISWTWRETGADDRICDLIDGELSSIDAACSQILTDTTDSRIKAAFATLREQIPLGPAEGAFDTPPRSVIPPSGISLAPPVTVARRHERPWQRTAEADLEQQANDADAEDEAVLDLVAAAMAAPADDEAGDQEHADRGGQSLAAPVSAAGPAAEPVPVSRPVWMALRDSSTTPWPRKRQTMVGDPMEPIRRMSQAETIAFFS